MCIDANRVRYSNDFEIFYKMIILKSIPHTLGLVRYLNNVILIHRVTDEERNCWAFKKLFFWYVRMTGFYRIRLVKNWPKTRLLYCRSLV